MFWFTGLFTFMAIPPFLEHIIFQTPGRFDNKSINKINGNEKFIFGLACFGVIYFVASIGFFFDFYSYMKGSYPITDWINNYSQATCASIS